MEIDEIIWTRSHLIVNLHYRPVQYQLSTRIRADKSAVSTVNRLLRVRNHTHGFVIKPAGS